jgi:hypothetical protein
MVADGGDNREMASELIREIGEKFVKARKEGRSGAWGELEDQLMLSAHIIISAGLMSPKDWVSLAIDIEQFRKSDSGTSKPPGDWLSEWLSTSDEVAA